MASEFTLKNRELLWKTLESIDCSPHSIDNDEIRFRYQGELFSAMVNDNLTRLWDLPFLSVHKDSPELSLILETINSLNNYNGPTIMLMEPDENGNCDIASRFDILFFEYISDLSAYLKSVLNLFFWMKQSFQQEYAKRLNAVDSTGPSAISSIKPSQN